jgi:hypothetical protein
MMVNKHKSSVRTSDFRHWDLVRVWRPGQDPTSKNEREMIEFDYLISEFYLEVNVSCFPSFMFEEGNDYVYGSVPFRSFLQVVWEFNKGYFLKYILFKNK